MRRRPLPHPVEATASDASRLRLQAHNFGERRKRDGLESLANDYPTRFSELGHVDDETVAAWDRGEELLENSSDWTWPPEVRRIRNNGF